MAAFSGQGGNVFHGYSNGSRLSGALGVGLLALTLGCGQAIADNGNTGISGKLFGRYTLTKGFDDPMCLAVGEQVAELKAIRHPENYPVLSTLRSIDKTIDFRCDVPLAETSEIKTPTWQPISVFDSPEMHGLYFRLYADNQMKRYYNFMTEIPLEKKRQLVLSAQNSFVADLLANGIYRFEEARFGGGKQTPLQVYRLNKPFVFLGMQLQQCWSVSFDPKGPMAAVRGLRERIVDLFTFEDEAFALAMFPERTISVFSFERLKTHTENALRTIDRDSMSQCQFTLNAEARN